MKSSFTQSFVLAALLSFGGAKAQNVGIGLALPEVRLDVGGGIAAKPDSALAAAALTIPDNVSTFYIRNVAGVQANAITGPVTTTEGQILIIDNKDDNNATFAGNTIRPNSTVGFIRLGNEWKPFGEAPSSKFAWSLYGNLGTFPGTGVNQNFLGTRDVTNLIIATATTERIRVLGTGNVVINNNFNDYSANNPVLTVNATGDDPYAIYGEHDELAGVFGAGDIVGTYGVTTDYNSGGGTIGVRGISNLFGNTTALDVGVFGEYGYIGAGVAGVSYYISLANLGLPANIDVGVFGHANTYLGGLETGGFFHAGQNRTYAIYATQSGSQTDVLGTGPFAFSTATPASSEVQRIQHNGYTTGTGRVIGMNILVNAFATPGLVTNGNTIGTISSVSGGITASAGGLNPRIYGIWGNAQNGAITVNNTSRSEINAIYAQSTNTASITGSSGSGLVQGVFAFTTGAVTYTAGTGAVFNNAVQGQTSSVPTGANAFVAGVSGFATATTGVGARITGTEGITLKNDAWAGVFGYNASTTVGTGPGLRAQGNYIGTNSLAISNATGAQASIGVAGFTNFNAALSINGQSRFGGYFGDVQSGSFAYVGGVNRAGGVNTNYKIIGPGTVSTIVENTQGKKVTMFAPEAPEVLFQDYGKGQLTNGKAVVTLDPDFAKNITGEVRVFVQLEGDCNGVYVTNKTTSGFEVVELNGGKSNVPFTYTVVANRADEYHNGEKITFSTLRYPDAPKPQTHLVQEANRALLLKERKTVDEVGNSITSKDIEEKQPEIRAQKEALSKGKKFWNFPSDYKPKSPKAEKLNSKD